MLLIICIQCLSNLFFLEVVLLTMDDAETVDYTAENFSLGDYAQPYDSDSMLFSMHSGASSLDQDRMRMANGAFVSPICIRSLKD